MASETLIYSFRTYGKPLGISELVILLLPTLVVFGDRNRLACIFYLIKGIRHKFLCIIMNVYIVIYIKLRKRLIKTHKSIFNSFIGNKIIIMLYIARDSQV